ncbi:MAG: ABC transporter ATP-binding protein [Chloroflexi bacterium GWC2_73_18]|nr:MAG: ABC transporter ATP-binding protein [Chloroflexi bacterium GWC2_73_18]
MTLDGPPLIEARGVSKYFGKVIAIEEISLQVRPGEVVCLLGDNGAGKSTLIKILSGVFPADSGSVLLEGEAVHFASPRDAIARGIATVYQDLAMIPLMSISRNFFLGSEPRRQIGPISIIDFAYADRITRQKLDQMGIHLRDTTQSVGTLSGGERQSVAIARAEYFGAKVLILDEPTSALGVKEAAVVLRHIVQARARGLGVILITHNVNHAYPVGDRFLILDRGRSVGTFSKAELRPDQLLSLMGGGEELSRLSHELESYARAVDAGAVPIEPPVQVGEDVAGGA